MLLGSPGAVAAHNPTLPAGGNFVAGAGSIGQSGSGLTIRQATPRAIIDWNSFSIGANNAVTFDNGAGATLNRVTGGTQSSLLGSLKGTGSIYLINPEGVLIGRDASVNVGGSFIATTRDIPDASFMSGGSLMFSGDSSAAVINLGGISAAGGDVFLIAQEVENHGKLSAMAGTAGLAAGSEVRVQDSTSDQRVSVKLGGGKVVNTGTIKAAQAELKAADGNIYALAGNDGGQIYATGTAVKDGHVWLTSDAGEVTVTGTVSARNADGSGGAIETSGRKVAAAGAKIDAGKGGAWLLDPDDITIDAGLAATIDSSLNAGTNVTEQTTASGTGGSGDITVASSIAWTSNATLTLDAFRDVVIDRGATISNPASGSAATRNAIVISAGGAFVNNEGVDALSVTSGRWLVWSQDPANNTAGGLSPDFIQYNASFAQGLTAQSTGNGLLYTLNPTLTASLVGAVSKTYNDSVSATLTADNYALTGQVNGDTVTLNDPTTGTFDNKNVGTGKAVAVKGLSVSANNGTIPVYGYSVASSISANIGTVTPATLKVLLNPTINKVYDGTTNAAPANGNYSLIGAFGNDHVTLNNPTTGFYDNKNVGSLKLVTVTGLALTGADAGNYTVASSVSGNVGVIAPAFVTATLTGTVTKTYDSSTSATLAADNYALTGVITGDNVFVGNVSGLYDTKNAGTGKLVTVTDLAISGTDAGNYALVTPSASANIGTINQATLTASLTGTVVKTYDATANATLTAGNYALTGIIGGDVVSVGNVSGLYDSKNAGSSKQVTVTGLALTGTDAGNYTLTDSLVSANIGTINQATLTAGLTGTVIKTYDGTANATLAAGNYTLTGVISGDSVALNDPTAGLYDTRNAGTGKLVTAAGLALSGTDAGNYILSSESASANIGTINRAVLTASLIGTVIKTYDGNTNATLETGNYTLSGVIGGDSVTLNDPAAGLYDTKNAGTGKLVTVSGLAVSGSDAGNYSLSDSSVSADIGIINQATLTAGLTGAVNKTYNGDANATLDAGNYTLTGVISGDIVTLNDPTTGLYDDKNAGAGKLVTSTSLALSGTDAGNYILANPSVSANIGTISQATLTAGLTGTVTKTYDATVAATLDAGNYTLSGLVSGDSVTVGTVIGVYDTKAAGAGKLVSVTGLALSGTDAGNYLLSNSSISANIGTINQATLTAGLTGTVIKTYDGNANATLIPDNYTLTGVISGDSVALNDPASGLYDTKNAGSGKLVTVTGLGLSGADATNYALSDNAVSANIGTINQAVLTASLTGLVIKTYDGTANATLGADNYSPLSGIIGEDSVALNDPTAGLYDTKNAGTGKLVTVTGLALTGSDAGNYTVASSISAGIGTINRAGLTASLTGAVTKTYDGTATATIATDGYTLAGLISGDSVIVGDVSAVYDNKNAGSGKRVSVTGLVLTGADAGNYTLSDKATAANVGIINQATLTAGLVGNVVKTYDGNANATLTADNYTLTGAIGGDTVSLNDPASGLYDSKNAGTGKLVTATGLALSGADAGNYTVASSVSGAIGTINQATLTAGLTGTVIKTYDGTVIATLNADNYTLAGIIGEDSVTVGTVNGVYDTKAAGTNKLVSVTGLALSGGAAGNYVLSDSSVSANIGTINQAMLTAGLTGTVIKTYDGNANAALTAGNYTLTGVISGDSVALNDPASGLYDNKNAGSGKLVTVTDLAVSGADAGNYVLSNNSVSANIGTINQAVLTAGLIGTVIKTYDGTANAALAAGNYTLGGVMEGDSVALNDPTTGLYDTKNAGTGKLVTASGLALTGTDAGNYTVASSVSANIGTINQAVLTAGLTGTVAKTYDGGTSAALVAGDYTLAGLIGDDSVALNDPTAGLYDTKNAGTGKLVTVAGLAIGGTDAANYVLSNGSVSAAIGVINQATLTAGLVGTVVKTYDGNASATFAAGNYTLAGVVDGDTVGLNDPASGSYDSKNAGSGKLVTATGLALSGADAGNYTVASSVSANIGTINQATLTAGLTGTVIKTYDGNAIATLAAGNYALAGIVGGDDVSVATVSGLYDNKKAGTGKLVSMTGLALAGTDAGNYLLSSGSVSANIGTINPATLVAGLAGTVVKTYDGNANAALAAGNYTLTGTISGDSVALNDPASGLYDSKNAGSGKLVTVTGLAVSGSDAANYVLSSGSASANIGTINQATLTANLTGTVTKTYDGTAGATLTAGNYALAGVIGSDSVALNDPTAGLYDNKNAGIGKLVTANGLALTGTDGGNYTVASSVSANIGTIDPAALQIVVNDASRFQNVPNPPFTVTYDGLAPSDSPSVLTGTLVFSTTATPTSPPGMYAVDATGLTSPNYVIGFLPGVLTVNAGTLVSQAQYFATNIIHYPAPECRASSSPISCAVRWSAYAGSVPSLVIDYFPDSQFPGSGQDLDYSAPSPARQTAR